MLGRCCCRPDDEPTTPINALAAMRRAAAGGAAAVAAGRRPPVVLRIHRLAHFGLPGADHPSDRPSDDATRLGILAFLQSVNQTALK
jgi:hypothetical protein